MDNNEQERKIGMETLMEISKSMRLTRTACISVELKDFTYRKTVAEKVKRVVEEFHGEVVEASYFLDTLFIKATFLHRRYKALEKAIAAALVGLPVGRITVGSHDLVTLRLKRNPAA